MINVSIYGLTQEQNSVFCQLLQDELPDQNLIFSSEMGNAQRVDSDTRDGKSWVVLDISGENYSEQQRRKLSEKVNSVVDRMNERFPGIAEIKHLTLVGQR